MTPLQKFLTSRLKGAKKTAILGIGSEFRSDDAAGIIAAEKIVSVLKKSPKKKKVKVFIGSTAPENLTGEIKKFKPTHLIIIDTIEIKEKPGTIIVLTPDEVGGGVSFSSHKMPAKILIDYLAKSFKYEAIMIGIQPRSLEFDKSVSREVKSASLEVASAILSAIE